jgi:hypothetical protein
MIRAKWSCIFHGSVESAYTAGYPAKDTLNSLVITEAHNGDDSTWFGWELDLLTRMGNESMLADGNDAFWHKLAQDLFPKRTKDVRACCMYVCMYVYILKRSHTAEVHVCVCVCVCGCM